MYTVKDCLDSGKGGLHYGNRLILPFKCHFLKVIADRYIFTDFSPSNKGINIVEHEEFTDLYFCEFEAIKDNLSKYEPVKLIIVEKECDIFDVSKHIKIAVYIEDKNKAKIEFTDQDILFLE